MCPTLCDPIDGSPPGPPSLGFSRQEHWSGLPYLPSAREDGGVSGVSSSCGARGGFLPRHPHNGPVKCYSKGSRHWRHLGLKDVQRGELQCAGLRKTVWDGIQLPRQGLSWPWVPVVALLLSKLPYLGLTSLILFTDELSLD